MLQVTICLPNVQLHLGNHVVAVMSQPSPPLKCHIALGRLIAGPGNAQVNEATEFQPQVRGEVGAFAWHYISHLPASEEASMHYNNTEGARHRFFQVCTGFRFFFIL